MWFRNLQIDKNLSQRELDCIKRNLKLQKGKEINIVCNPDKLLFWQYDPPNTPLMIIDIKQGVIKTTQGTIDHFGLEKCQQEASQILCILRKHRHAKFRMVVVSTYRLGDTPEQRKKVLTAFSKLYCFNEKDREEIKGWIE